MEKLGEDTQSWDGLTGDFAYLLLNDQTDPNELLGKVPGIVSRNLDAEEAEKWDFRIKPMSEIYFGALASGFNRGELNPVGEAGLLYGFSAVAVTLRESHSASHNGWSAIMLDDTDCSEPYRSSYYDIQIVDRVGGGDAFAGGLIAGILTKSDTKDALEFAVAASCLKQTIPGDFNAVSTQEVERLVAGSGSGRVER